jgi:integrase
MPVRDLWVNKRTKMPTSRYGMGNRYQAVWTVDGQERTRTFARKVDAERHLAVTVTAQLSGGYVDPRTGRVTVRAYAEQWLAHQLQLRDSSRAVYTSHLSKQVYPVIGHMPIGEVSRSTMRGLVSGLVKQDLAPQTVRAIAHTCSMLFRAAVADQVIARSPMVGVKLPAAAKSRAVALTVPQLYALAEHLPREYRALPLLGAGCGLRPGELLGLEVDPARGLDMLGRRILVRQQLAAAQSVLAPPKTAASVREVPLADETLQVLAEHLAEFPPVDVEVEDRTGSRPVRRAARLLFTTSQPRSGQRGPVKRAGFNQAWNRAVERARAAGADLPDRITPHAVRHTYVSLMIAAGAHPKTIQAMVGHKNISETLDTYGHLMEGVAAENTRAAIGAAFRQQPPTPKLTSVP